MSLTYPDLLKSIDFVLDGLTMDHPWSYCSDNSSLGFVWYHLYVV